MRLQSSLLLAVFAVSGASAPALAQSLANSQVGADDALFKTAFTTAPKISDTRSASPLLKAQALVPGADAARPLQSPDFMPGRGPSRWFSDEVVSTSTGGSVNTVRLAIGETQAAPVTSALTRGPYQRAGFDLSYTRGWPSAVQFNAGAYDVAFTPHAGLGVTSLGGAAEAGATLRLEPGKKSVEDRLGAMGVKDGKAYGEEGRWYLFAAASGRAVGLNMTRTGGEGGWNQSGWSTDRTSKLIGDGQLGVGYRKGAMQAAFGYVYREIKLKDGPLGADNDVSDSMAAFSLSIRPDF